MFERLPLVILQFDADLQCTYANAEWTKVTGLSLEASRGEGWMRAVDAEDAPHLAQFVVDPCPGDESRSVDAAIVSTDGGRAWLSGWIAPVRGDADELLGYTGVFHETAEERRLARRLLERDQRLASIFHNDHTAMLVIDPDTGAIIDASVAAEHFYGYSTDQLRSMRAWDLTTLTREVMFARLTRARARICNVMSSTHKLRDGSVRDVEVHVGPFQAEGRELLLAIILDVTERKSFQDQLFASEDRYRRLVEMSPDGMFVEADHRFVYVNPAAAEMLGAKDPAEIIGQKVIDFIAPECRDSVRQRQQDIRLIGRAPLVEERFLRLDGTPVDVEALGVLIDYQGEPAAQVMMRDITERKRAEEAARWAKAVIDSSSDAMVGFAVDGSVSSWNPAAERIFGYSAEEIIGQRMPLHGDPQVGHVLLQLLEQVRSDGEPRHIELSHPRRDGSSVDLEVTLSPVTNADGDDLDLATIIRDISERRQLEQAKDDFLAMASHELRTPLTGILGYATMLKRGGVEAEDAAAFAERIETSAQHMQGLVEEILQVLQVESSTFRLRRERVDLSAALDACIGTFGLDLQERIEVDAQPIEIECDPGRLTIAVSNLLANALKFSTGPVVVSVRHEDGEARIAVSDEGVGIEPAQLERIFSRFEQADMSSTRGFGGFGLGLYIARRIVEEHGGVVEVESEPGIGSTFTIRLPYEVVGESEPNAA